MMKITKAIVGIGLTCVLGATGCGGDSGGGGGSTGGTTGGGGMGTGGMGAGGMGAGGQPTGAAFPADAMSKGKFVTNKMTLPARTSQARMLGCNLDGMGEEDNQLGNILAAVASQGVNAQDGIDSAIMAGSVLFLFDVVSKTDLTNAPAGQAGIKGVLGEYAGATWDAMAAFGGMGMFRQKSGATEAKLGGTIANGVGDFGPDRLQLSISLVEGGAPLTVNLIAARVTNVTIAATGLMGGKICGAITEEELNGQVLPTVARLLIDRLNQGGDTARTLCNVFDTDKSCASDPAMCAMFSMASPAPANCITDMEIKENPIVRSVLKPDVTLNGTKALSLGVGFEAVKASF